MEDKRKGITTLSDTFDGQFLLMGRRPWIQMDGWPRDLEIGGWSESVCSRTGETREHVLYVAAMTVKMARKARIPECDILNVRNGALLHDIGKLGVPEEILLKPCRLSLVEWEIVCHHPRYAYEMLFPMSYLRPYIAIPYCHHEKWDGSGYPRGLKGDEIPLPARLFAVVDVWDALTSDRSYRKAWPQEKAIEYIQSRSGSHFDPMAVELFISVLSERMPKAFGGKKGVPILNRRPIKSLLDLKIKN